MLVLIQVSSMKTSRLDRGRPATTASAGVCGLSSVSAARSSAGPVVGIFPNDDAIVRLVGGDWIDRHENLQPAWARVGSPAPLATKPAATIDRCSIIASRVSSRR
ncbi:hypothetical protein X759_31105 [Mesorhizobium sp. LSHC420B00]|nr:hypothetical protein X759_31105 [Mesorhizobium sp. LSHC420B00]